MKYKLIDLLTLDSPIEHLIEILEKFSSLEEVCEINPTHRQNKIRKTDRGPYNSASLSAIIKFLKRYKRKYPRIINLKESSRIYDNKVSNFIILSILLRNGYGLLCDGCLGDFISTPIPTVINTDIIITTTSPMSFIVDEELKII